MQTQANKKPTQYNLFNAHKTTTHKLSTPDYYVIHHRHTDKWGVYAKNDGFLMCAFDYLQDAVALCASVQMFDNENK
jgi:hypothetical protein